MRLLCTHRPQWGFLALVILCSLGPAMTVSAQMTDRVVTRNGDELTGEVKSVASGRLDFKTAATDTIQIHWDHVVVVTSRFFFEVLLDDGRRVYGALLDPVDPGTLRIGTDASAISVSLGEIAQIERIRASFWSRLKGSVDLGFTLNKANNRTDLSFKVTSNYRTRKGAWGLSYENLYRRQDNTDDLIRHDLTGSYQRFLGGHWLVAAFAAGQRNTDLALDLRAIVGVGGGFHVVRTVEHDLIVMIGLDGAHENFLDEREPTDSVEAFIGVSYDLYALGARDFIASASATVFPSLSVADRLRSEVNLDIRKELWKDFYVPVRGFFSSDSTGGTGEDPGATNDYGVTLGIGYSW